MNYLGIDLGTTNTLVAVIDDNGDPVVLPNGLGEALTPSVVGLSDDKTVLVGKSAQRRLVRFPAQTIARFKRAMGTEKEFRLGKATYSATDLSAILLRQIREDVESQIEGPLAGVVISVPAYFNSVQRKATLLAGELAGFKVSRLINEPTAAALAYGVHDRDGESTFIVLDLGGGTFDVSILEMFDGVMEVRASAGDAMLGGEDFTLAIAKRFANQLNTPWADCSPTVRETLTALAETAKRQITSDQYADVSAEIDGKVQQFTLTEMQFEEEVSDLSMRLRRPIERCLYDAGLKVADLDRVVLVGGATRMRFIRGLAARIFQRLPERALDPDTVVALGAAVQAALSENDAALDDMVMTDVSPFSLGIASNHHGATGVIQDAFAPIIERNTVLPASRVQHFFSSADKQTEILVRVYQGESPMAVENTPLGELKVRIPPAPKGQESIAVRFSYDVSGLLQVEVTVVSTQKTFEMLIEGGASGMSASEKAKRIKALEAYKVHPKDDQRNQAVTEALKHLYAMLLGPDRVMVTDLIAEFDGVLATQDPRIIEKRRPEIEEAIAVLERKLNQ
ncbi:MAG: Hsp70 family protein [Pikeienuella sp.]